MNDLDEFLGESLECKRAIAVKMDLEGYASDLIEELLQVSASFVRKWRIQYRTYGIDRLYLQSQGSQGLLSQEERAEVIAFLTIQDYYRIEDLRDYIEKQDGVVYRSKQSYYDLLHEAKISWKKTEKSHPDKDDDKASTRRTALQHLLKDRRQEIESGELVVFLEDECH